MAHTSPEPSSTSPHRLDELHVGKSQNHLADPHRDTEDRTVLLAVFMAFPFPFPSVIIVIVVIVVIGHTESFGVPVGPVVISTFPDPVTLPSGSGLCGEDQRKPRQDVRTGKLRGIQTLDFHHRAQPGEELARRSRPGLAYHGRQEKEMLVAGTVAVQRIGKIQ